MVYPISESQTKIPNRLPYHRPLTIFLNKSTLIDFQSINGILYQYRWNIVGVRCAANKRLEKFVRLKAPVKLHPVPSIIQFSCPLESGRRKDGGQIFPTFLLESFIFRQSVPNASLV